MSSANQIVSIMERPSETEIVVRCTTGTSGGFNDHSDSAKFALMLLTEAREQASYTMEDFDEPPSAIEQEAENFPDDWYDDDTQFDVSQYIADCSLLGRENAREDDEFSEDELDLADELEPESLEEANEYAKHFHTWFMKIRVTDARWLQGIETGWVYESTAY